MKSIGELTAALLRKKALDSGRGPKGVGGDRVQSDTVRRFLGKKAKDGDFDDSLGVANPADPSAGDDVFDLDRHISRAKASFLKKATEKDTSLSDMMGE